MDDVIFHDIKSESITDARGWVANPLLLPGFLSEFGHLHVVSMNPGSVRGNHYHKTYREWLFIFGGDYEVYWNSGERIQKKSFTKDEFYTIEIPPGISHVIKNISDSVIYLVAYQNADKASISADTIPSKIPEL